MDEVRFRKLSTGDLIVPARGAPPKAPEGYYQSPGDKYKYHPIRFNCDHTIIITLNKPNCGCTYNKYMCGLDKQEITPDKCKECQDESKTIRQQVVDSTPKHPDRE